MTKFETVALGVHYEWRRKIQCAARRDDLPALRELSHQEPSTLLHRCDCTIYELHPGCTCTYPGTWMSFYVAYFQSKRCMKPYFRFCASLLGAIRARCFARARALCMHGVLWEGSVACATRAISALRILLRQAPYPYPYSRINSILSDIIDRDARSARLLLSMSEPSVSKMPSFRICFRSNSSRSACAPLLLLSIVRRLA